MRWIGWLMLALVVVGWLATEVRLPTPAAPTADTTWRRTRDGWQRADWLADPIAVRRPALHPSVVWLLELLVSLMALVAFAPATDKKRCDSDLRCNPAKTRGLHQDHTARRQKSRRPSRLG